MRRSLNIVGLILSLSAVPCWPAVVYDISMNTTPLMGHPAGPFSLEFQLNDGRGTGDGNNTAVISNLTFGGGSGIGVPSLSGGVSGNAGGSITMADTSFFNQFIQRFTPGTNLAFRMNLSTNVDSGGIPDQFSFAILDGSGVELPTLNSFFDVLVLMDIDSANPALRTFGTDVSRLPANGGGAINIAAPTTAVPNVIPEPNTRVLMILGVGALVYYARRRLAD